MINRINNHIDKFLESLDDIDDNQKGLIKNKYATTVTDDLKKGHITSNVCMITASVANKNPKELAEILTKMLSDSSEFKTVESAGPGFINVTLHRADFTSVVNEVNKNSINYGQSSLGKSKSVQIEFVSANPTGPLHVGHGRGASYGDAIGRILSVSGYKVEKEYYVNDAGRQIDILTASVFIKVFKKHFTDFFPKNAYKGSYIEDISIIFIDKNNPELSVDVLLLKDGLPIDEEKEIDELILRIKKNEPSLWFNLKDFALNEVLTSIKDDLKLFNVSFDQWFYESSLGDVSDKESKVAAAINTLKDKELAYEEKGAIWLNTSSSGDDKNRVLIRDDGRATYFASDVAYHKDKVDRGFNKLINVWGADHHGYIKRIEASLEGLGFEKEKLSVQLVQFANLFKDGKKVKMSTRSGDFYSLADLIKDIGTDAARFYYLSKQADQHLDFDLDLAKSDTKENMFYYIQYAHARICSLITKYKEEYSQLPESAQSISNGSYKSCDKLIHEMSKYPNVVSRSCSALQPHLIIFYLKDFAHTFHSFYNDNHVLTESRENIDSIIYCLCGAKTIISNGLGLLGIKAIEKM
ncbi:MAG: arginine--tRNA ligase [Arcobacter sp.]|nr:arginine--tRNA ligase [Arcobacter sp.]|tara:strand:- start:616 stop:2361 length:1746 start_codon:yes stop_codon:yes gene_type:complete